MSAPDWVTRLSHRLSEPPRTGAGSSTAAWQAYATAFGYPVPDGSTRAQIIALVDAGPPPAPPAPSRDTPQVEGPVYEATRTALEAATHLTDMDQPAAEVLLDLAKTIDGMGHRHDNITVPNFLKYADALGLTPAARARLDMKPGKGPSKLGELRSIRGGRAATG